MRKTRQDNDVIDHTSLFYAKNETKLSCLIQQGTQSMMKTRQDNNVTDRTSAVYGEIKIELS